ncbi:hypothetical protein DL769_005727 [Monosporascus sp. CRB-8-3]|nr:hypothetical protein DL769_005727 [Monosporascus sp. CRB-8-3]
MLTVGQVSGLIAAAFIVVQYILPLALVVILINYVGSQNNAVTWSIVNRTISTTIWPHLLRADSVNFRYGSRPVRVQSWAMIITALLLVPSSVLAPLGLSEEIVPTGSRRVEFAYAQDTSSWGRVTMPRPELAFGRLCETGLNINCPGQYQGVYMNETSEGVFESTLTDDDSTINSTIPLNYTNMFYSATSNPGNTVSGLFDIQYRRWHLNRDDLFDKGATYAQGDFRFIDNLIPQEAILLKEGLIVDMTDTPGIGFRNHTVPVGLEFGATWSEDLTWIEPVTQCVDTNLSIEVNFVKGADSFFTNYTYFIVDRGAWIDLDMDELETRPWLDNQTLDLFGRAYKAARMSNVLAAASLNISLPLDSSAETLPKIEISEDVAEENPTMFSYQDLDTIVIHELAGFESTRHEFSIPNTSDIAVNHKPSYPDGYVKLLALNYTAVTNICRGYYYLDDSSLDMRANNISNPAVDCGFILGPGVLTSGESFSPDTYTGKSTYQRKMYICSTGMRASIKTVDFYYNETSTQLSSLEVSRIAEKTYPDDASKPLWAVEHSYERRMWFDPLWGLVNDSYEMMEGFYTQRSDHLWLPMSPHLYLGFGEAHGIGTLAAASSFVRHLGNLYGGVGIGKRDYSGEFEYTMIERIRPLFENETAASQVPSLVMTDGLAANLVGTKTSLSNSGAPWPASLAADSPANGFPQQLRVSPNTRVIRYDIRFAIPGLILLGIFVFALAWAITILVLYPVILRTLQNTYNQTSAGRLAASLLKNGSSNANLPTDQWVKDDGKLLISFGYIDRTESDYFCRVVGTAPDAEPRKGPIRNGIVRYNDPRRINKSLSI